MCAEPAVRERRFADVEWKLLSDLIESKFGLVFDDARREILEQRLSPRLQALHLNSFKDYYHYLMLHPEREREFIEVAKQVTNGETYFFRESHHFDILRERVVEPLIPELRGRPLRVLSAGCSSGQEPYTIAMTLRSAGVNLGTRGWLIDACDIHPVRIAQARSAEYGESSLRACDEQIRRRYFDARHGRFRLRREYTEGVRFFETNLATERGQGWPAYDAVFCRNVMIYFSDAAFDSTVDLFRRCLAPNGWLFLGHSESLINRRSDFEPVCVDGQVVYRKQEDPPSSVSS